MSPQPSRTRARRALLTTPVVLGAVMTGCATTPPAERPQPSTSSTASTTSATPSPATSTPVATPATPVAATPSAPSTLPARPKLVLSPVTRVANTTPTGMAKPACPMPRIVVGATAWSPAGDPKVNWPTDRRLKPGTNHAPVADAYAYPAKQVVAWMTHKAPQPKKKLAFLTFDDGPNGVTTPMILKTLREEKVPATFFLITRQVNDTTAPVVREQVAEGHAVAIHSYGHQYGYLYPRLHGSATNIACDLDWSTATLSAVLGKGYRTSAFRYPGGHNSWRGMGPADAMLAKRGITSVDWNSMNGDADSSVPHHSTADMVANVPRTARMAGAKDGDVLVVLMHDFHPNPLTTGSLRAIIKDLKKRGYTFGVIS